MKINYSTLNGMILTKKGNLRKGSAIYVEKPSCKVCDNPYLDLVGRPSDFCSVKCARAANPPNLGKKMSEEQKQKISNTKRGRTAGSKHPGWKGGVTKLDLPLYDTFANQINYAEVVGSYIDNKGRKLLKVKCSKCNSWYVPSTYSVRMRISSLKGTRLGESRLYCSDECKNTCEVYNQHIYSKYNKPYRYNYDLSVWSQEVLKRANYECEICGDSAEHAHHIEPKKLEPGFALDPENGLALCKMCHYKHGHSDECSTGKLANVVCK